MVCTISVCSLYYFCLWSVLFLFVVCTISVCSLYYFCLWSVLFLFVVCTISVHVKEAKIGSCISFSHINL